MGFPPFPPLTPRKAKRGCGGGVGGRTWCVWMYPALLVFPRFPPPTRQNERWAAGGGLAVTPTKKTRRSHDIRPQRMMKNPDLLILRCEERSDEPRSTHRR